MRAKAANLTSVLDSILRKACTHHADLGGIRVYRVLITPALASKLLEFKAGKNRPLRPALVDHYATEIKRDYWKFTHQGIAFDERAADQDGQHRLSAIVKADKGVEVLVFTNMPVDSYKVLDQGKNRTFADIYPGVANGVFKVSVARMIYTTGRDNYKTRVSPTKGYALAMALKPLIDVAEKLATATDKEFAYAPFASAFAMAAAVDKGVVQTLIGEVVSPPNIAVGAWAIYLRDFRRKRLTQHQLNVPYGEVRMNQFKHTLAHLCRMLDGHPPPTKFRKIEDSEANAAFRKALGHFPKSAKDEMVS